MSLLGPLVCPICGHREVGKSDRRNVMALKRHVKTHTKGEKAAAREQVKGQIRASIEAKRRGGA